MQPSVDEVEELGRQRLMSDPTIQEHFLKGLGPMLGGEGKRSLDLSRALVSFTDLLTMELPERPRYLPWLPAAGNVMVFGPRGVGKTFFQLALTASLSSGTDLWGWKVEHPVGVLYIDGEMHMKELRDRLTSLMNVPPAASLEFLTSQMVYERCEGKDLILTSEVMP